MSLPFADLKVSWPGFGVMGFNHHRGEVLPDEDAFRVLSRAIELGCTFWDTATIYGYGANEELLGRFFKAHPGAREKVFLASKCGHEIDFEKRLDLKNVTNTRAHILEGIKGSIQRLGTNPDLYYIHRMDGVTPLEESIGALKELKKSGECRYIGLSEMSAETLGSACKVSHIDCVQIEYSPWCLDHEADGVIDACRELGVSIVAYSPLGRGILTGQYRNTSAFTGSNDNRGTIPKYAEFLDQNLKLVDAIGEIAQKRNCTPGQLCIAWVAAQGAIPIPGTKQIGRLEENWGANGIQLTKEESEQIRAVATANKPVGARYGHEQLQRVGN